MDQAVSEDVVDNDHLLEEQSETANRALYEHRWHWTIDKSNPNRVSYGVYARAVGRSRGTIRMQALGFEGFRNDPSLSLHDHVERANMGPEKADAMAALATAMGINYSTVRKDYSHLINETQAEANRKAKDNNSSYAEELPDVAEFIGKADRAKKIERAKMRQQHGLRFISVENQLTRMRDQLRKTLEEAREVEWTAQERQLLGDSVRKLSTLLNMVDLSITGTIEVDWDAELAKLA